MLKEFPVITEGFALKSVQLANELRKCWGNDDLSIPYSMRQLINFVDTTTKYRDPAAAFRVVYYDTLPEDSQKQTAKNLFNNIVGFGEYRV